MSASRHPFAQGGVNLHFQLIDNLVQIIHLFGYRRVIIHDSLIVRVYVVCDGIADGTIPFRISLSLRILGAQLVYSFALCSVNTKKYLPVSKQLITLGFEGGDAFPAPFQFCG